MVSARSEARAHQELALGIYGFWVQDSKVCSRSPKVGNPIASILKSKVYGIPALFVLNPVSNFLGYSI